MKLKSVRDFWRCLARLGGFIGRKSDGEPGSQVPKNEVQFLQFFDFQSLTKSHLVTTPRFRLL